MNKRDSKKSKKIRKLIVFCSLTSFIFIVATYAWFIGMRSVNVSSFEIEIASTDSLLLSLDGSKWDTTVTINSTNFNNTDTVYEGNVNNWAGIGTSSINKGLKPISSVGEIDTTTSTMKMFEKGSLTATSGGYRLLASRIHNNDTRLDPSDNTSQFKEIGGYVAFDLFIRNFSGRAYYTQDDILNEEAIYLTDDSEVKVSETGGVSSTGIENSVRVAFAQIGRVNGKTTDVDTITGITCANTSTGEGANATPIVTGICRTAQIWEPNDTLHTANAISYYDTSCRTRDNNKIVKPAGEYSGIYSDIYDTGVYSASNNVAYTSSNCAAVAGKYDSGENAGQYIPTTKATYAITREIGVNDYVDVYDGEQYNGYTKTTRAKMYPGEGEDPITEPLFAYDYFTDSEKILNGMQRPELITLAPNSITKVRVYVWIEGQDIDNYDFSSIGKQITVNFGFTKERFDENEILTHQGTTTDPETGNEVPTTVIDGPGSPSGDVARPVFASVPEDQTISSANVASFNPMTGVSVTDVGPETTEEACTTASGTWSSTGKCYINGIAGNQENQSACTEAQGTWLSGTCTHNLTTKVQVTNPVTSAAGEYVVRYLVSDWQGNYAEAATTVTVN